MLAPASIASGSVQLLQDPIMKNPLAIQLEGLEPSQRPPRSTHAAQIATAGWPIREPLSLKTEAFKCPAWVSALVEWAPEANESPAAMARVRSRSWRA